MSLSSVSVRRYVFAAMLNAVIVLFGFVAWQRIGIERLPNIDFATVTVTTRLEGANPEIVDASVTNVLEGAISSLPGLERLVSTSAAGLSTITLSVGPIEAEEMTHQGGYDERNQVQ